MVNLKNNNDYNKAPAFLLMVCFFLHLRDFLFILLELPDGFNRNTNMQK